MRLHVAFVIFLLAFLSVRAERPQCFSGKLDLVLVIDVSGSVENRFLANRDAALEISKSVVISWEKATIAVIQYSRLAIMKLEFGSSETWDIVNDTISNLEWTGDVSQTAEAMDLAMIQFRRSRPDAERAIVLFSDGNSFNSWNQVVETSERLKYSQAKIFAVSLGGNTYETELKQYLQFSNGTISRRQSEFQQLKRELQEMTVPRCPPPVVTMPPETIRPLENNIPTDLGDGGAENQLPTRRSTRRNGVTRSRLTTRSSTSSVSKSASTITATSPIANLPATTPIFVDTPSDKRRA